MLPPRTEAVRHDAARRARQRAGLAQLGQTILKITGIAALLVFAGGAANDKQIEMIDLSHYRVTFDENFDALDVSAWGPGTRWIAHTPWNGDFGDAKFVDPEPGFPFTTSQGLLKIEARKEADGKWASGLLASVDTKGNGFAQKFGYFEMRAKLPRGAGLWSAFWLIGRDRTSHTSEVDVLEHYGHDPTRYTSTVHVWDRKVPNNSKRVYSRNTIPDGLLYDNFNTYGVKLDPEWTTFYFNRKSYWRTKTPPEHHQPMYILLNLGLGAGWPIDKAPSPAAMTVDYVRAWEEIH